MKEKVVLAYSGGLDTTAIIPWLKETFDYDVVCCCIDCGQAEELDGLEERAKMSGASKLFGFDNNILASGLPLLWFRQPLPPDLLHSTHLSTGDSRVVPM